MTKWRLCVKAALAMIPISAGLVLMAARNQRVVRMQDKCDPTTFNAAAGDGTCVGDGTITFDHFIAELTAAQKVGAWHYDPTDQTVEPGTALTLENRGGETHTFTKVAKYGGGFVPPLNALSGNPVPAPECATVTVGGLIPKPPSDSNLILEAGETEDGPIAGSAVLPSGTITKFQCCIHPWMRLEVRTK